jgi:phage gp36-like protein
MATLTVTLADVQARLSAEAYARLFDPNGTGSVDATWLQTHLDDALAEVNAYLRRTFGDDLPDSVATSRLVIQATVHLCASNAALAYPGGGAAASDQAPGPYQYHRTRATTLLKDVANDLTLRPALSAERPRPRATVANTADASGAPTNPYTRVADHRDPSGW